VALVHSQALTRRTLALAASELASRDTTLNAILQSHGNPPLWRRPQGFRTLVHIILEQQVSLRSGKAMFDRLESAIIPFAPETFLICGREFLRGLGVTRQKAAYLIHLAELIVNGQLDLTSLSRMGDEEVRQSLMNVKGIGAWSADVYLLMAMCRADIWPAGDLALAVAAEELFNLRQRPSPIELELLAEKWRPHRAVAARMLWQYYLATRAKAKTTTSSISK